MERWTRRRPARHAAAALAAMACAWSTAAQAACHIKGMVELPITMVGTRAMTNVGIDGHPVSVMVDSGAFYSMLTDATAAQLNLSIDPLPWGMRVTGLTGDAVVHRTTVDKLELLGGTVPEVEFLVGGNEPGSGAMGIMGRNLLTFTDTEYDLPHGVIRFAFPNDDCGDANMAYWAGSTPVVALPLLRTPGDKRPPLKARVKINDEPVIALFDTGATTLVSHSAALRAGVTDAAMTPEHDVYGIGLDRASAWTAPFAKIEIGGEAVSNNRLAVADIERQNDGSEMLLGIDFFLSHRIYVSKRQSKMYFTYAGGPVFALNRGAQATAVDFDAPHAASGAADAPSADQFARRGAASLARHDDAGALADLDRACALAPDSASYRTQRGLIHELLKHRDKALQDFDQALVLDPAQVDARFHRAGWRVADHDRDGALQDLAELDKRLPAQAPLRLEMARMYAGMSQHAQVIAQLDGWIPVHPNDIALPSAQNLRCWTRVLLNRELDKAMRDCDEAVDADDRNAAFLDSRGWVYLRQGKLKKAVADFDRGLAIKPAGAWSLYGRGLAHLRLGETGAGEADLAAARAADRDIDAEIGKSGLPQAPAAVAPAASSPPSSSARNDGSLSVVPARLA